jgi:hypothetical protein
LEKWEGAVMVVALDMRYEWTAVGFVVVRGEVCSGDFRISEKPSAEKGAGLFGDFLIS